MEKILIKKFTLTSNKIKIDIPNTRIVRLWTDCDEGKKELIHLQGFFLEERYHDWRIVDNILYYSSRIAQPTEDNPVNIVVEYLQDANQEKITQIMIKYYKISFKDHIEECPNFIEEQLEFQSSELNNHIYDIKRFLENNKDLTKDEIKGVVKFELQSTWGNHIQFEYEECARELEAILKEGL
jgi:hypothetical protein